MLWAALCGAAVLHAAQPAAATPEVGGVPAPTAKLYVAPSGNDAGPGSVTRPFRTIERARAAVLELRRRTPLRPVTVLLRKGTHHLQASFRLGKEDSGTATAPVTYAAYLNERPVLTGGIRIGGFRRYKGSILRASLSGVLPTEKRIRVVVVDGVRQEPARYPNNDPRDPNGGAWAFVDGKRFSMYADSPQPEGSRGHDPSADFWQRNIPELTRRLTMRPQDARRWSRPADIEVSIFPRFNWAHYVLGVESIDRDGRTLRLAPGSFYEIRPGDRYFVRNALEELDAPGEWYHDRTARALFYRPRNASVATEVFAATVDDLVSLDACSDVTIRGLTLECAEGSGVVVRNCRRVTIAANTIRNVGDTSGSGVVVEGGRSNRIVGNDIHDTGSHGIALDGGDVITLTPGSNRVDNNYIHHVGRVARGGHGVYVTGARNVVSHNLIHDTPHSAVFIWGAGHTVEYNRIRHTCLETEDSGAVGGGAIDWLSWQDMDIRYNRIEDTMGFGYDEAVGRWRSPYFATALYPDWAASGVRIIGNVLVRAPRALLLLHSGRDNIVRNNVLVDGGDSQIACLGWTTATGFWSTRVGGWVDNYETARRSAAWRRVGTLVDPRTVPLPSGQVMTGNVMERNIVAYRSAPSAYVRMDDVPLERHRSDRNVVFSSDGHVRTGIVTAARDIGGNLLANPGLETRSASGLPEGWAWATKASPETDIAVRDGDAHGGRRFLAIRHGAAAGSAGRSTMVAPGPPLAFRPGRTYRFSVWLRAEGTTASVSLQAYTWKQDVHNWTVSRTVQATPEWKKHEITFRLPGRRDPDYRPTMDLFYARLLVPETTHELSIDDVDLREVEPMDEWAAWRGQGQDVHSVKADPQFVDWKRGDYRLKSGSPALKMGFDPIPFERIGPYRSALRASWPIYEAPGARESIAQRGHGGLR